MDKYIYDENNGLWHELQSDYEDSSINAISENTEKRSTHHCSFFCVVKCLEIYVLLRRKIDNQAVSW